MPQDFAPGDFLVFQLEAGFGLLRVLGSEGEYKDKVWHIAAYRDLFCDVESAEVAAAGPLTVEVPHVAVTNRAFESTQVAKLANAPLDPSQSSALDTWRSDPSHRVEDRSIRLLLGLR
jgi:hypothetical protein